MTTFRLSLILFVLLLVPLEVSAQETEGGPRTPINPDEVILVAGATGRLGQAVVRELKQLGYKNIRGMTRDRARAIVEQGSSIEWVTGNVTDPDSLRPAFEGVDRIISAVGSTREPGNGTEAVNYKGVMNITDIALESGVKVFVLTSSAGVTDDEDNELNKAFDNVLLWKLKGEDYLRASGLNYAIMRPGGLKSEIAGGQYGIYLDQGDDTRAGQISIEDVASVLIEAANNPEAHGKTFEVFNYVSRFPAAWPTTFSLLQSD